jgi:uncharacterized protein YbcI
MNDSIELTLEQQLSDAIARYHREQQGHLPKCSTSILPSMAIVRSTNIFTGTESELSKTPEGKKLIQSARREQRALTRREIEGRVSEILDREISRSFYDLDVRSGEQIEIYILD